MQQLERVQARVDRLGALDVRDRRERARRAGGVEVPRRAGDRDVALALERQQPAERARHEAGRELLADRRRGLAVGRLVARAWR